MAICLFRMTVRILIKKLPVPTERATVILIRVKSCTALLRMLLICVSAYLKSDLKCKFLILDTYRLDTLYLREQGYEIL